VRPIQLAQLDKLRPELVLTREEVRPYLNAITVAPITSTRRGLTTEVEVGTQNGLDHVSFVNCDAITTVPAGQLGRVVGYILPQQEPVLSAAIAAAFDLE
jgi:mRNA interferase MazF